MSLEAWNMRWTSRRRARRGGHAVVPESAGCLHVRGGQAPPVEDRAAPRHRLDRDDVFGDLGSAAERPPAVKAWDRDGRVIYCGSCSKSMAPGFRLGWVLGGRHQRQLESLKIGSSLAAPLLEQQVLADYMKSGRLPAHLRRLRTSWRRPPPRRAPARSGIFPRARGCWARRRLVAVAGTARAGRHLALLRVAVSQGIAYTPGALFSAAGKHGHCLRLNVARPWSAEMAAGLERLGPARLAATRNQAAPRVALRSDAGYPWPRRCPSRRDGTRNCPRRQHRRTGWCAW